MVARITHYYIVIIICVILNYLVVGDAKGHTTGAKKYFVVQGASFTF